MSLPVMMRLARAAPTPTAPIVPVTRTSPSVPALTTKAWLLAAIPVTVPRIVTAAPAVTVPPFVVSSTALPPRTTAVSPPEPSSIVMALPAVTMLVDSVTVVGEAEIVIEALSEPVTRPFTATLPAGARMTVGSRNVTVPTVIWPD